MAKSVGMFQRPVEYRVNCLELIYNIPELNLSYVNLDISISNAGLPSSYLSFGDFNISTNIVYSGYADIKICFVKKGDVTRAELVPLYRINTIHTVNLFYKSDSYSENIARLYDAHNIALSSLTAKIAFYDQMISWIKLKLIDKGYDAQSVYDYEYVINFPFSECFGKDLNSYCNDFYLQSGSALYDNGVNTNTIIPVGQNSDGITLWDYPGIGTFNTTIRPNGVGVGDGRHFYLDQLVIDTGNNFIDPIVAQDTNVSEDRINSLYNSYKDAA